MSILNDYIKDLAELVNRDAGTANYAGVTSCAKIMKAHFESIGFTAELINLGDKAGNGLLVRNKPEAGYYDVVFCAHLDTVFPDGTAAARPFSIDGDIAHGPGCSDCKAGVLAIYYAMKTARKEDLDRLSICIIYNPDEETGSYNSRDWFCSHAKLSKRAVICEPARPKGEMVSARKGCAIIYATFHGRAAHAGNNMLDGRNALIAMSKFILEAIKINDFEKGVSVSPDMAKAGNAANVVPELASVTFDMRFWFDEDGKVALDKFRELGKQSWGEDIELDLEFVMVKPAMSFSEATKELVETMSKAATMAGFDPVWVKAGGASDGNEMALMGIPVVDGCAPAGGGLHSDKEYLRLDTVENRIVMLTKFLELI